MRTNQDDMVTQLLTKVRQLKEQIADTERYAWRTNCSFQLKGVNYSLQVVSDTALLGALMGNIKAECRDFEEGCIAVGIPKEEVPTFKFFGYTVEAWQSDIQARYKKITVKNKRDQLAKMEERLNSVMSPELRTKIELEAIQKELGS